MRIGCDKYLNKYLLLRKVVEIFVQLSPFSHPGPNCPGPGCPGPNLPRTVLLKQLRVEVSGRQLLVCLCVCLGKL